MSLFEVARGEQQQQQQPPQQPGRAYSAPLLSTATPSPNRGCFPRCPPRRPGLGPSTWCALVLGRPGQGRVESPCSGRPTGRCHQLPFPLDSIVSSAGPRASRAPKLFLVLAAS
ncbi:hypothetical protein B2J93_9436 [Marssonina coronariae]|uniref:Uncharacterized protein n=1 Tax=Diplocarpon coronariae TaxID=2795749 RepID=A0A218YVK1_9HELO|nr:hypothetical protein B2J93_9436 [Marssonina coronariae]